jgi:hypothetical protein
MKPSPHVLLITRYFPPLDSIATIRMYSWAKYLHQKGWEVSILTTSKHHQVVMPLTLETAHFNVCEVEYFDPISSLGFDKKQISNENQQPAFKKPFTRIKKWAKDLYRERMNERMPSRTDPWIFPALKELKKRKKAGAHYDYIISSYGPPSAHIVGHFAKKIFKTVWLADYRDLWIENHFYKGLWPFTLLERVVEKQVIKHADMITTVSAPLQTTLAKKFPKTPVHVIENGFDPSLMDQATTEFFSGKRKTFRIVYTGSLHRQKRNPAPLFQAIKELIHEGKITSEDIEVLFFTTSSANLSELIASYGMDGIVHDRGAISFSDAYSAQKSADCLLFLEAPDPAIDGILTGKLFEYLYAQSPILAVGIHANSAPGRLIENTGAGVVCGNTISKIKTDLLSLMQRSYKSARNEAEIMKYTREKQVDYLIQLLMKHRHVDSLEAV